MAAGLEQAVWSCWPQAMNHWGPASLNSGVSPRLCTWGWQPGCVPCASFPRVMEMDEEKALEQGCSYRDLGQCSLLFCRGEVKIKGR